MIVGLQTKVFMKQEDWERKGFVLASIRNGIKLFKQLTLRNTYHYKYLSNIIFMKFGLECGGAIITISLYKWRYIPKLAYEYDSCFLYDKDLAGSDIFNFLTNSKDKMECYLTCRATLQCVVSHAELHYSYLFPFHLQLWILQQFESKIWRCRPIGKIQKIWQYLT